MDELARRRKIRARQTRTITVPPMDGSVEQVAEDLQIVAGMTEEVLAETRAIPTPVPGLHAAVVAADDAVGKALAIAKGVHIE